jgi:hypothetical protein
MSRSSVSAIVTELMERGLVNEQGAGHSKGRRRPLMLSLNSEAYGILRSAQDSPPDVEEQALPPAIVAGAYLSCAALEGDQVECYVADESDKPITLANDVDIAFSYLADGAKAEKSFLSHGKRRQTALGSIFF